MRRLPALLLAFAAGACASSGAIPQPFPTPGPPPVRAPSAPAAAASSSDGYAISGTALSLLGVPYRNGGSDPSGFDCSGFVWYVFTQHGVTPPRTVWEQYRAGTDVDLSGLRPGDLVFFNTSGGPSGPTPTHVGISIGGDQFVHAPSSSGQVRVERLGSSYWAGKYVGARRIAGG
jgi:cell wall-associated NlpC family hydrolase